MAKFIKRKRLDEATFKPTPGLAGSHGELTLDDIPPEDLNAELPKIKTKANFNNTILSKTLLVSMLKTAFEEKVPVVVYGDTGVSKSATIKDFYKGIVARGIPRSKGGKEISGSKREACFINGVVRPGSGKWIDKLTGKKDDSRTIADVGSTPVEAQQDLPTTPLAPSEDIYVNPGNYFFLIDLRVSSLNECDMYGLPQMGGEGMLSRNTMPPLCYLLSHPDANGIVFFDEINRSPYPEVQNGLLPVFDVGERKFGHDPMNRNIFCIGAANYGGQEESGYSATANTDAALKARGMCFWLNLTIDEWLEWGKSICLDPNEAAFNQPSIHYLVRNYLNSLPNTSEEERNLFRGRPTAGVELTDDEKLFLRFPTYRGFHILSNLIYRLTRMHQEGNPAVPRKIDIITQACLLAGGSCGQQFKDKFEEYVRKAASSLSLDKVEKMKILQDTASIAAACNTNILAYADSYFIDKDSSVEKDLKGWCTIGARLTPENQEGIFRYIKIQINNKPNKATLLRDLLSPLVIFYIDNLEEAVTKNLLSKSDYQRTVDFISKETGTPISPKPPTTV
jgi:hypothetical protein